MNNAGKQWAAALAVVALIVLMVLGYRENSVERWEQTRRSTPQAAADPLLAMRLWLESNGHPTQVQPNLQRALPWLRPGVLLISDDHSAISVKHGARLLAWVRAGNTLIMTPPLAPGPDDDDEDVEEDAVAGHFSVQLHYRDFQEEAAAASAASARPSPPAPSQKAGQKTRTPESVRIKVPGIGHMLQMAPTYTRLVASGPRAPVFADSGQQLLAFREGRGQVIFTTGALFNNASLQQYDHAELLLALSRLDSPRAHVSVLRNTRSPHWYQLLWDRFELGLAALVPALLLLLWAGVRRFGPLLPEADQDRRALLEHIDASGRWLWKVPGGRSILLQAARAPVVALLQRRLPGFASWTAEVQQQRLSRDCAMSQVDIRLALHDPVKPMPGEFTRQIQLLQGLRKHYER